MKKVLSVHMLGLLWMQSRIIGMCVQDLIAVALPVSLSHSEGAALAGAIILFSFYISHDGV